ncbi:something about silencing protein 10 [Malassezia cuniculi]|uniref:Something about silencing protein 10 n=1 Tax=Malassezia cuniculi TaxID=948313 RepID=A0AAF0J626_9BASI|nr:something about silencing protein 10 [Malassezia cuniculi]
METRADIPQDDVERFDTARDMILLDGNDDAPEDEFGGDEREVLGFDEGDEDEDDEEDEYGEEEEDDEEDEGGDEGEYDDDRSSHMQKSSRTSKTAPRDAAHAEEDEPEEDEELGLGWGANKRSYYSGNTENDMESDSEIDEEKAHELEANEAIRLQRLSRTGLVDDEFGLGDIDEAEARANADEMGAAARQKRRKELDDEDRHEAQDLLPEELIARLQVQAPVFLALVNEYASMLDRMKETHDTVLQSSSEDRQTAEIYYLYDQTQSTYVMLLAFVFQLIVSQEYAGSPERLLTHPIMERLSQFKTAMTEMQGLGLFSDKQESLIGPPTDEDLAYEELGELEDNELQDLIDDEKENQQLAIPAVEPEVAKPRLKVRKSKSEAPLETVIEMDEAPLASVADVDYEAPTIPRGLRTAVMEDEDAFGEPAQLRDNEYTEKMAHRRSVQFHANQMLVRDANARGSQAGNRLDGDSDIPYRDRQRSRETVAATNANKAAKKRVKMSSEDDDAAEEANDDLGDGDWEDSVEDGDDDDAAYYDLVQTNKRARRTSQKEEHDRTRDESRIWDDETVAPGEHRSIDWTIAKNKGLTQSRPKSVRNPRVKRRMKFDRANKRLSSTRAVYKGGQAALQGGYAGEKSGISTHLVKSRKLG